MTIDRLNKESTKQEGERLTVKSIEKLAMDSQVENRGRSGSVETNYTERRCDGDGEDLSILNLHA